MALTYIGNFKEVTLESWRDLFTLIQSDSSNYANFIWRGQRKASWHLTSGLDRLLHKENSDSVAIIAAKHLDRLKLAARGRRGSNPNPPQNESEWWALAQHNAMLTPLLDWTESPFVGLYFAFEKEEAASSEPRAVWALSTLLQRQSGIIEDKVNLGGKRRGSAPRGVGTGLDFIRPMQDDNSRLVNNQDCLRACPSVNR